MALRLTGVRLLAPSLLDFEIGNIAWKKARRYPAMQDAITTAFGIFLTLPIERMTVQPAEVLVVALERGLTFYDASYLWLARNLGAELVTLDRRLQAAL